MAYETVVEANAILDHIDMYENNSEAPQRYIVNSDILGDARVVVAARTGEYTDSAGGIPYKDKLLWRSMQQLPDPGWRAF